MSRFTCEPVTKHTCGGPVFGRRTAGCPRCDELSNGAKPVEWSGARRKKEEARSLAALRAHFDSDYHRNGGCGPVCTFGDW